MATQSPLYTIGRDAVMQLTSLRGDLLQYRRTISLNKKFGADEEDYIVTVDIPNTMYSCHVKNDEGFALFKSCSRKEYNSDTGNYEVTENGSFFTFYDPDADVIPTVESVNDGTYNHDIYHWDIWGSPSDSDPSQYVYEFTGKFVKYMRNPAIPPQFDHSHPDFNWEEYEEWRHNNPDIPEQIPQPLTQLTFWFHSVEGSEDELSLTLDFLRNDNDSAYFIDKPNDVDIDFMSILNNLGAKVTPLPYIMSVNSKNYKTVIPEKYQAFKKPTPYKTFAVQKGLLIGYDNNFDGDKCRLTVDCDSKTYPQMIGKYTFIDTKNGDPGGSGRIGKVFINLPSSIEGIESQQYQRFGIEDPYLYIMDDGDFRPSGDAVFDGQLLSLMVDGYLDAVTKGHSYPFVFKPITEFKYSSRNIYQFDKWSTIVFPKKLVQISNIDRIDAGVWDSLFYIFGVDNNNLNNYSSIMFGKFNVWKMLNIPLWSSDITTGLTRNIQINNTYDTSNCISEFTFNCEEGLVVNDSVNIHIGNRCETYAGNEVTDEESYELYKDGPYVVNSSHKEYYPFNGDSLRSLFASLPQMAEGVVGTIILHVETDTSNYGSATDGGGWRDLTDEDWAVATDKGWTITWSKW